MTDADQPVPERLYKYVTPARLDVLVHGLIRFTQPNKMNDVFEMQPIFTKIAEEEDVEKAIREMPRAEKRQRLKQLMRRRRKCGDEVSFRDVARGVQELAPVAIVHVAKGLEAQRDQLRSEFVESLHQRTGMLCLAEDPSNLLMWAHYALRHEGFVIEFNTSHKWFEAGRAEKPYGQFGQVRYADKPPSVVAMKATDAELYLMKSSVWRYEREWRLLRRLQEADATHTLGNGETASLFRLDRGAITAVVMGCRMREVNRASLISTIGTVPELAHVRVRQAVPQAENYSVRIEDAPH